MALKSQIAREFRAKFPEKPTLALARIVHQKNKEVFDSVEAARSSLRYIEGKKGSTSKKSIKGENAKFLKEEARPFNPYNLPESFAADYKPFIVKGHKRVGILNDIHLPYHHIDALTVAIKYLKSIKIDAIFLNGDVLDFHGMSRFMKDPRKRSVAQELEAFRMLMDVLEKQLGVKIYYKLGNHDERYQHYLWQHAGEFVGVDEFEFKNIIKARSRDITIIGDKRIVKFNGLNGIHGHEYVGGAIAPVNIARGLYMKGKVSAFQGHNHASSEHTETDMNGKITTTFSVGCLCELNPEYMPLNKWNLGFAYVDLDSNGKDFEFHNKRIFKGKVL
jgi:predicted phosphodiesterase